MQDKYRPVVTKDGCVVWRKVIGWDYYYEEGEIEDERDDWTWENELDEEDDWYNDPLGRYYFD